MQITETNKEWLTTIRGIRDYSQEQFDKLIVYLSSGGLILTAGFVQDLIVLPEATIKFLLFFSWIGFVLSLILILLSHKSSIASMTLELEGKPEESDVEDKKTNLLNSGSFWLFVLAVTAFITFIIINFNYHE